jgi:hypothetical protein
LPPNPGCSSAFDMAEQRDIILANIFNVLEFDRGPGIDEKRVNFIAFFGDNTENLLDFFHTSPIKFL